MSVCTSYEKYLDRHLAVGPLNFKTGNWVNVTTHQATCCLHSQEPHCHCCITLCQHQQTQTLRNIPEATQQRRPIPLIMPLLPNEILDQIWLERCKLSFEPRILQAKWVREGRLAVPAFYTAQPQEAMTQLCYGSRQVAAKGFYIQIDADADDITRLLLDWFPMLSQVFFLCAARLIPAWQYEEYKQYTEYKNSARPAPRRIGPGISARLSPPPRLKLRPVRIESASTKLLPISTFCKVKFQRVKIPSVLFIRAQGLMGTFRAEMRRKRRKNPYARNLPPYGHEEIPFFIFGRDDTPPVLDAGKSRNGEGRYLSKSGHAPSV